MKIDLCEQGERLEEYEAKGYSGAAGGDRERERFKEGGEEVYRCDSEEVENVKHF